MGIRIKRVSTMMTGAKGMARPSVLKAVREIGRVNTKAIHTKMSGRNSSTAHAGWVFHGSNCF
jgi:hypothetical protein